MIDNTVAHPVPDPVPRRVWPNAAEERLEIDVGLHRGGGGSLRDIDWMERRWDTSRAYSESKLYIVALAFAVARRWSDVLSNAVNPGWVPTKMGGASRASHSN